MHNAAFIDLFFPNMQQNIHAHTQFLHHYFLVKQYPSHTGSVSLLEFWLLIYLKHFLNVLIATVDFSLLILTPLINFLFS